MSSTGFPPDLSSPPLPEVVLGTTRLHAIDEPHCVEYILDEIAAGRGGWVVTPNLDHIRRLWRDTEFHQLCSRATLRVADGRPLLWGAALQGTPLPGLIAGSNLIYSLSEGGAQRGASFYFLGGDEGTAEATAQILSGKYPGLNVAGTECPPFGFEQDDEYLGELERRLVVAAPDVVFVALGSPKQEEVIDGLRTRLPGTWFLGIGISFSFVAGVVDRAPRWMQRVGLEWLHRLCQEPRRLARRYLVDGVPFALVFLASCLLTRLGQKRS